MLQTRQLTLFFRRFKHRKDHWSVLQKKKFPKDKALENFDDFYGSVYGIRWKSIRLALLCENKYIALVNNFGDTRDTIERLEADGAINVRSIYNLTKDNLQRQNIDLFSNGKVFKMDQKLGGILAKQQQDEVASVYPENDDLDFIPKSLNLRNSLNKDQAINDESLIDDNADLDYKRVVDSSLGTAGLYEYIPATKLKGMEDWVLESDHYKYYDTNSDFPINIDMETEFEIPENLHMFTYEKGNVSQFIRPRKCITGVLSHFLMDGGSILPPLALNIQPGERVLDLCAAPGGKSLLMLQTLHPNVLVCNDVQESRCNRIKKIMNEYVCDFGSKWNQKRCYITQEDGRAIMEHNMYDKVLVDVPCTTDRHAVTENDNNIFKPSRLKERLRIPELQAAILSNALQLLKPGGSLVYSTCSLSPIQNDGVIHMALSKSFTENGITATVKDLSLVMKPFEDIFKFENPKGLKYGQMVLPYLPANYGPMYFSKITRNN